MRQPFPARPTGRHTSQRASRRARGPGRLRASASRRWSRAAGSGLFVAMSLALSTVISHLVFHRNYAEKAGVGGYATDAVSFFISIMCVALAATFAAQAWSRTRRRLLARPRGQAGSGPPAGWPGRGQAGSGPPAGG